MTRELIYENGTFSLEGSLGGVHGHELFEELTWRMMKLDLGQGTLLLQAGQLIAPIFVVQTPPARLAPWWSVSVVQYHQMSNAARTMKAKIYSFISDHSMIGEPLDEELLVFPGARDPKGWVRDKSTRLVFKPSLDINQSFVSCRRFLSLTSDEQLDRAQYNDQLLDLCDDKVYALLDFDHIRDDYPKHSLMDLVDELEAEHSLETEIRQMLGA